MTTLRATALTSAAFAPFGDPVIFLFLGSFILAEALSVHQLDKRLALGILGPQIEVTEVGDGVFELRPVVRVPAHQQWFWADRWQAMEREADADIAAGRVEHFDDIDAFLNDLDR